MPAKIMKWASIAALLLLLVVLWRSSSDYRTVLAAFVVWAGASVVFVQAAGAGNYVWAATFLAVGALFNPVLPIMLPRNVFLWLDLACLVMFLVSLAVWKANPRLSIPSITDPTPRSESL
jgi:hypothetical protein